MYICLNLARTPYVSSFAAAAVVVIVAVLVVVVGAVAAATVPLFIPSKL